MTRRAVLVIGLAATAALLIAHALSYAFLTDDAFISFRYARNLSHGHGLVFNPGQERVEGYSNFLWVLVLAALDRVGLPPERTAIPLSLLATLALWGVMAAWLWRRREPGREWLVLIPLVCLAATRSVAVWSTSGLETRLFELAVVAGALRLVDEIEAIGAGRDPGRPLAAVGFGLAALTRPDGMLFAGCAFLASAGALAAGGRFDARLLAARWWPCAALVVPHLVFRRLYYGDWVPNTFHAKVGRHLDWAGGKRYLAAFALEYSIWLWAPLLLIGLRRSLRDHRAFPFVLAGALLVPFAIYVAAIGGDHFEFRPLDIAFPIVFLLFHEGARAWATTRGRDVALAAYVALLVFGLAWIPWRSHRQFPSHYSPGFPGVTLQIDREAERYLSPPAGRLFEATLLADQAAAHRDRVREMTARFAGIRQEEHRMFLDLARAEGTRLRVLVDRGVIPKDAYLATDCVGAIPYFTELRTLDRLGLTDAFVARSENRRDLIAHEKAATLEYARERGVDLWVYDPVYLLCPLTSWRMLVALQEAIQSPSPTFVAEIAPDTFAVCLLPLGVEAATARMPNLAFRRLADPATARALLDRLVVLSRDPDRVREMENRAAAMAAKLLLEDGHRSEAVALCKEWVAARPMEPEGVITLAFSQEMVGDTAAAVAGYRRALELPIRGVLGWSRSKVAGRLYQLTNGPP